MVAEYFAKVAVKIAVFDLVCSGSRLLNLRLTLPFFSLSSMAVLVS